MEFAPILDKVAFNLMKYAATVLPNSAVKAIKTAYEKEDNATAKSQLGAIIKNFETGAKLCI
ncbi:MAG: fumarate hydratase, partial [Candidatus Heimdallarchaeota archaeon]